MKRVLFIYYLLGGLLFLLPDWLNAQGNGNMVGIELTGKQEFGSNVVFDYRRSEESISAGGVHIFSTVIRSG